MRNKSENGINKFVVRTWALVRFAVFHKTSAGLEAESLSLDNAKFRKAWSYTSITLNSILAWCSSTHIAHKKGKAVPLQSWSGPEGSRKLRFPHFMTTAQNGGKVVSPTHRTCSLYLIYLPKSAHNNIQ